MRFILRRFMHILSLSCTLELAYANQNVCDPCSPLLVHKSEKIFQKFPADISFAILDLKYTHQGQVKICEMQPGSLSIFSGYDYLMGGDGLVPKMFCQIMSKFQNNFWYFRRDICDQKFRREFIQNGWNKIKSIDELTEDPTFRKITALPIEDPNNLHNYHGVLYLGTHRIAQLKEFKRQYPGILVMDSALSEHFENKGTVDDLFKKSSKLTQLRPQSQQYPKVYSENLVQSIFNDIDSETYVIKPINGTKGLGVIIVDKENLDITLKYIFEEENIYKLRSDVDQSYSYWTRDKNAFFLVEEFIESKHVSVPQFNDKLYDGTIRTVVMLIYQQKQVETIILEAHWKLPQKSVEDDGSFNEKHKSYGKVPHFLTIEPQILESIHQQLSEAFDELYEM